METPQNVTVEHRVMRLFHSGPLSGYTVPERYLFPTFAAALFTIETGINLSSINRQIDNENRGYYLAWKKKHNHKILRKMDGHRTYNAKQGHAISEK